MIAPKKKVPYHRSNTINILLNTNQPTTNQPTTSRRVKLHTDRCKSDSDASPRDLRPKKPVKRNKSNDVETLACSSESIQVPAMWVANSECHNSRPKSLTRKISFNEFQHSTFLMAKNSSVSSSGMLKRVKEKILETMYQTQDMHHAAAIVQERRQRAAQEFEMKIVDSLNQSYPDETREVNSCLTSPFDSKGVERNSFKLASKKMLSHKFVKKISSFERPRCQEESVLPLRSVSNDSVASPLITRNINPQHHNITLQKETSFKLKANSDGKNYLKKHCDSKFICSDRLIKRQKSNSKVISFEDKYGEDDLDEEKEERNIIKTKNGEETTKNSIKNYTKIIEKCEKVEDAEENKDCVKKCRTPLRLKLMTFLRSKSCIFNRQ